MADARSGTASPAARTGRLAVATGTVLLLAGLAVAGYLAWQLVGTTWVAHQRYADQVSALRLAWDRGEPSVDAGHGRVSAVVGLPSLGVHDVPLLEGTSAEALASGVGHFDGTAPPGGRGNFVIGGHRVTHGEPLRDMPDLEVGDEVVVETGEATYTYVLDTAGDALAVSYDAGWVLDDRPVDPDRDGVGAASGARRLLTIVTCAELFHTDSRLVAFGHLVDVARHGVR